MAADSLANVQFVSGRLVKNPTSLVAPFPYGGTQLGLHRDVVVEPSQVNVQIKAEEFGETCVEVIDCGRSYVVGTHLRGWDKDAIATIFPGATGSGRGFRDTMTSPRAGALLSARAIKLLFVPDNLVHHRMVYLYKAVPMLKETAELNKSLKQEHLIATMWLAMPDSNGAIYAEQLIGDLTL